MASVKKAVRKIHLVLAFTSGLVVFMLAVTGCLYVFEQEITHSLRKDDIVIRPELTKVIPLSQLWQQTQNKVGYEKISWVYVYNDPAKSWVFTSLKRNAHGITYFGNIDYYTSTYVNPYTGEIIGVYDEEKKLLNIVKYLHWSLLLKTEYGQPIIGWSTFIFVFTLISGLILWWPKNKKAIRKRFWLNWKKTTRWRRKIHDLHSVFGFYTLPVVLIIALSGMVWAFPWFKSFVYVAGAGTSVQPDLKPAISTYTEQNTAIPLDIALRQSKIDHPVAEAFRITPPNDSTGIINVAVQQKDGAYFVTHNLQFDQYSGQLLRERSHEEKNFGEKLSQGNYDIHTGIILGFPGKILAFIASLVCATLPVTGFMLWYGRASKEKSKLIKSGEKRMADRYF
jgi:uncharacterized iron-regulated membrane protein